MLVDTNKNEFNQTQEQRDNYLKRKNKRQRQIPTTTESSPKAVEASSVPDGTTASDQRHNVIFIVEFHHEITVGFTHHS